jgi:hypothetical protein
VEQIRDSALKLRMVPIGETFTRFNRVVRDLGQELGKDVELVLNGADTELDKSMIEKVSDPLMHLVRNALDHGLESPEVRKSKGKLASSPRAQRLPRLRQHRDRGRGRWRGTRPREDPGARDRARPGRSRRAARRRGDLTSS